MVWGSPIISVYSMVSCEQLGIAKERVAIRGEDVMQAISFDVVNARKDSLMVTPIGICLSYYEQSNNFIFVAFNDQRVKLYDNSRSGGNQHHLVPVLNPGMDISLLPVYRDHGGLSLLTPDHVTLPVHSVLHRSSPFGKQIFIGEPGGNGSLHHRQPAVVVKFHSLVVKCHKNKIIALLIIA